jgi:hypothetical protein
MTLGGIPLVSQQRKLVTMRFTTDSHGRKTMAYLGVVIPRSLGSSPLRHTVNGSLMRTVALEWGPKA